MSPAHTDEDIKLFKESIRELTLTLLGTGHLTKRKAQAQKTYPMIAPQKRFRELSAVSSLGASASHICISAKVKGFLDPLKLQQALNILARKKDLFRWRADLSQNSQFFEKAPTDIDFEAINLRQEKTPWKILDKMLFERFLSMESTGLLMPARILRSSTRCPHPRLRNWIKF